MGVQLAQCRWGWRVGFQEHRRLSVAKRCRVIGPACVPRRVSEGWVSEIFILAHEVGFRVMYFKKRHDRASRAAAMTDPSARAGGRVGVQLAQCRWGRRVGLQVHKRLSSAKRCRVIGPACVSRRVYEGWVSEIFILAHDPGFRVMYFKKRHDRASRGAALTDPSARAARSGRGDGRRQCAVAPRSEHRSAADVRA